MRPKTNRELLRRGLVFWLVFTVGYGALRLLKQDEWRWDHLIEVYVGMLIPFVIVWVINNDRRADVDASASPDN